MVSWQSQSGRLPQCCSDGERGSSASHFWPLLAVSFVDPFGYPDYYQYSEPMPIWWSAMFYAFVSACLTFASALIKNVVEARRHQSGLS